VRLAGVLDEHQLLLARERQQRVHVRRVAVEMDRQQRLRARRDRPRGGRRVDVERPRVDVDEYRGSARLQNGERRKGGRDRGGDDLVTRADAARPQREVDGVGAVAHAPPRGARRAPAPARARRLRPRAEDEEARVEHAGDRAVELAPQRRHVRLEVHEGNLGRAHR
jgi:hypothetical protein